MKAAWVSNDTHTIFGLISKQGDMICLLHYMKNDWYWKTFDPAQVCSGQGILVGGSLIEAQHEAEMAAHTMGWDPLTVISETDMEKENG